MPFLTFLVASSNVGITYCPSFLKSSNSYIVIRNAGRQSVASVEVEEQFPGVFVFGSDDSERNGVIVCSWYCYSFNLIALSRYGWSSMLIFLNNAAFVIANRI